jgi:hypothetical protein
MWVMARLLLLLAVGFGTSLAAAGEAEKKNPSGKEDALARLVADLGSDDFATREAAAEELGEAGPAALPLLEKAVHSNDAEVRRRATELAEALARRLETARVLEPKRLRLVCKDMPLPAALEDFSRQSGCRMTLDPNVLAKLSERKLTLDTGYTTFWDAYEKFCAAAGLTEKAPDAPPVEQPEMIYSTKRRLIKAQIGLMVASHRGDVLSPGRGGEIVLTEGKPAALPTVHAGALRVRALPPGTPLGPSLPMDDGDILLGLEVVPEPSLVWQGVQSLRVEKAVDDRGQTLVQPRAFLNENAPAQQWEEAVMWSVYNEGVAAGGGTQQVPVRLRPGKGPASRLEELQGTLTVRLQTAPEPVATLDNVLRSAGKGVKGSDGTHLKLQELTREEGGLLRLRVQVEYPAPEGMEQLAGWNARLRWAALRGAGVAGGGSDGPGNVTLLDAKGHLVRQVSAENLDDGTGGPGHYRLTFQPAPGQEPAKLVVTGRRNVVLDVPFRLRDVPLR